MLISTNTKQLNFQHGIKQGFHGEIGYVHEIECSQNWSVIRNISNPTMRTGLDFKSAQFWSSLRRSRGLDQNARSWNLIQSEYYRLFPVRILSNTIDYFFIQTRRTKSIIIAQKSILKSVKLQSLVAKCCKIRKIYSPVKLANFEYFSVAHRKMHHFWAENGAFFRA
jgi:hypothetical protein